ncbi:CPK2 [Symbiodinium pilosum]|uniref:non-specific serine/threonine protein kinase n=1 Tax=Symbiodinium pilosum TaxID=2952 RepID=A0A812U9T6_SYMPI|nr:CPK2 [Symbiodinium pilosum]
MSMATPKNLSGYDTGGFLQVNSYENDVPIYEDPMKLPCDKCELHSKEVAPVRMGGACHHCCEKPEAANPAQISHQPVQKERRNSQAGGRMTSLMEIHLPRSHLQPKYEESGSLGAPGSQAYSGTQLQKRANLQVKDGGFALGNFAATNTGRIEDFYELEKHKLGEGGFGSVRRGRDKRTGRVYAIKSIRKKGVEEPQKLKEEIDIMRLLDHPNIVRFQESFEDHRLLQLVLELCEGGELIERVTAQGSITERQAAGCVRDMLRAINYLHMNNIMHRDLKPENFLLATKEEIGKSSLKLIDFGLAKRFKPGEPVRTKAGTPNYVAPEVLSGRYDEKVDTWSIGVIAFLLLSGKHPFTGRTVEQVLQKVKNASFVTDGKHWKGVSADGKGFVQACLQKVPMARPSAGSCLKHRWIERLAEKDMDGPVIGLQIEGLAAFGRMHKLKKAVVTVIAAQMSEERIDELRRMFMAMDRNGDGTLTVVEVKDALDKAGIAMPGNMEQLLHEADTDGSGVIDYTEFLAATLDKKVYVQEDIVWTAFKKFDLDNNGSIDMKELAQVIGDEQVVEAMNLKDRGDVSNLVHIFEQVDKNGDGKIDFEEFFQMIRGVENSSQSPTSAGAVKPGGLRDSPMHKQKEEQRQKMSSLLEDFDEDDGGPVQKKASLSAKILY